MRLALILAAAVLAATPALAIDFSAPILDAYGKPVTECDDPATKDKSTCPPVTLGKFVSASLFAELPIDRADPRTGLGGLSGEQKAKNAALGLEIVGAKGDLKLDAEQVAMIKGRVGVAYPPLTVLRIWRLLDPNSKI